MDSPETAKTITNTTTTTTAISTDPVTVQDSPIFSYISNLSPIQPVNVAHAAQGFPGLHSPPLVFRSPYINSNREASFLKGPQFSQTFNAELSQNDDKCKKITEDLNVHGKSIAQLSSKLIPSAEKQWDTNASVQAQPCSSPGRDNEYLVKPEVDCAHSTNSNVKQVNGVPQLSEIGHPESMKNIEKPNDNEDFKEDEVDASPASAEQSEVDLEGKSTSHVKLVETEGKQNSIVNTSSDSMSEDHAFKELQCAHALDQASQQKCAIRRRCLFEEVHLNTIADSPSSSNPSNISKSPATLSNTENIEFSFDDLSPTSSNRKLVNLHQFVKTVFSPHNAGNSSLTVPKPSGIGLHLNSIVSALPVNCIAVASLNVSEKDCMNIEGLKSASRLNCHLPENIKISAMSSSVTDDVLASSEDGMYLIAASSTSELLYKGKKPLDNSLLEPNESSATAHKKRKFHSDHADSYEHHNQPSPKKKSKKVLSTSDGEGCKRCNCKRTKCLKLYCDCFAAGIYCAEPCACQGCFNRPEYEDTVLETRQQIESRNPLAFAPKVLKPVSESPADSVEELSRLAPSSARHKRGCNCKKSMCLKKYCECYQANVGCSDGCRCEGCKNVHGRKEDYGLLKESMSQRASIQNVTDTSDEKLKMVATRKGFSCTELYDLHNLTPLTPSFQSSAHGKEAARSQLLSRRYLPSPESDLTVLSSYGKTLRSPRNSDRHDSLCSSSQEMVDIVSYDQELFNCGLERVDPSSPSYDGIMNIYNDNPLTDAPSMASASSKTRDWMNGSGVELCPGSGKLSSGGSLRWRSSPITPMTRLGETKILQGFDSDSGLYDILEDGTPDILKESTPVKTVNVSSPKRKRVSPPNKQLHGLGSSSSGGLRSGRKFILQAVPSFPPLTPGTDTKGSTHQNKSEIQKDSRNK